MKVHEFEKIVNKLELKVRNSGDRLAWFEYDGQTVVRTKRSHGNKEQPGNLIRQQLKLNEKQLAGLIDCKVSLADYVEILKSKGIIANTPPSPAKTNTPAATKQQRFKWHVEQIDNRCIITREDGLVRQECPRSRLKQQMEPHGVVDDIFDDLCKQLDGTGKATVTAIQMGKFSQM